MAASLDLLLGKMQFLLSLTHLLQGPYSPHLKALLAVLKAYETQGEYAAKLKSRAEQMQEHVEDAADRAAAAERHAEAILNQQDDQAIELERQNKELGWENQKLLRKASLGCHYSIMVRDIIKSVNGCC